MNITIIGLGGVGQQILNNLLNNPVISKKIHQIYIVCNDIDKSNAIVEDIITGVVTYWLFDDRAIPDIPDILFTQHVSMIAKIDILICSYGIPSTHPLKDRAELLSDHAALSKKVFSNFKANEAMILVNVVNPVDTMSWYLCELSGTPIKNTIGISGSHNTARLALSIQEVTGDTIGSIKKKTLLTLGEHGSSLLPLVSQAQINNVNLRDSCSKTQIEAIVSKTKNRGLAVFNKKKSPPAYGPAASVACIINALLYQKSSLQIGSIWSDHFECFMSWPFRYENKTISPLELAVTDDDMAQLNLSATHLKTIKRSIDHG